MKSFDFFAMFVMAFLFTVFGFCIGVGYGDMQANKHWQQRMEYNQTNGNWQWKSGGGK